MRISVCPVVQWYISTSQSWPYWQQGRNENKSQIMTKLLLWINPPRRNQYEVPSKKEAWILKIHPTKIRCTDNTTSRYIYWRWYISRQVRSQYICQTQDLDSIVIDTVQCSISVEDNVEKFDLTSTSITIHDTVLLSRRKSTTDKDVVLLSKLWGQSQLLILHHRYKRIYPIKDIGSSMENDLKLSTSTT